MSEPENKSEALRTVAAVDIGTNAIRMTIAQILPDGSIEVLERLQQALRLGQDTFRYGLLRGQSMRAAIMILRDFRNVLQTYQVERFRVVATSAVREAANADVFIDRVLVATGMEVNVISAMEESRLTTSGVRYQLGEKYLKNKKVLLAEVGGGSTIMSLIDSGHIVATQSLPVGAIRMQESLDVGADSPEEMWQVIKHQIASAVDAVSKSLPLQNVDTFIALGADARWAVQQMGSKADHPKLKALQEKHLTGLLKQYRKSSVDQLARYLKLPVSDAETLTPALMMYEQLLYVTKNKKFYVSDVTMRGGLLLELAQRVGGKEDTAYDDEVLSSVSAMAKKYKVDFKHAQYTAKSAVIIYDAMREAGWLTFGERLLLEAASLLHEVGMFVSTRAYHKHSFYLISNSELFGLSPHELRMVAHIARYHRRSRPKPSHVEYMTLPRETRMIVNKLASILRVAEALDVGRRQYLKNFDVRFEGEEMIIASKKNLDLTLERKGVASASGMFQDIFGLKVKVE